MKILFCLVVLVMFLMQNAAQTIADTFVNYEKLILTIHRYYKTSSVFLICPSCSDDLQVLTEMYTLMYKLSHKNVLTIWIPFWQLEDEIAYCRGRLKTPLFVTFFGTNKSLDLFYNASKQTIMWYPLWLLIFMEEPTQDLESFCTKPDRNALNLDFDSFVITMCYNNQNLRQWYSTRTDAIKVTDLATWYPDKPFVPNRSIFSFNIRYDDGDKEINIVIVEIPGYVTERDGKLHGLFGTIFEEIKNTINFQVKNILKEKHYGSYDPITKSWDGALGKVISGEADIGVGAFMDISNRALVVDFSYPILISPYALYIRDPNKFDVLWSSYFKSFTSRLWITIVVVIFTITISITLMENKIQNNVYSLNNIGRTYINVWGMFCQQGEKDQSRSSYLKLAYFSSFLTVIVCYSAYLAFLRSCLTVSNAKLPFYNYRGFLKDGTYGLTVVEKGASYYMFKTTDIPTFRKMSKLLIRKSYLPKNFSDGFQQVCKERVAFFAPLDTFHTMKHIIPCKLAYVLDTTTPENFGFILVKDSPYKYPINHILQKIRNTGMYSRLRRQLRFLNHRSANASSDFVVALIQVFPVIVIFIGGNVLTFLVYLFENLHFRCTNRRN